MNRLLLLLLLITISVKAQVRVRGYYRSKGTYVSPHQRTSPNNTRTDNYSYPGNYNPNTGKITGGNDHQSTDNYSQTSGQWQSSSTPDNILLGNDYKVYLPAGKTIGKNVFEGNRVIRYAFPQSITKQLISYASVRDSYLIGNEVGVLEKGSTVKLIGIDYDSFRIDYNGFLAYVPFHAVCTREEFNKQAALEQTILSRTDLDDKKEYRRIFDDAPMYSAAESTMKIICVIPRSTILELVKISDVYWYGEYKGNKGFINDSRVSADVITSPRK